MKILSKPVGASFTFKSFTDRKQCLRDTPLLFRKAAEKSKSEIKKKDGDLDSNYIRQTISYLLKTVFSLSFIKWLKYNTLKKAYTFCHSSALQKQEMVIIV